MALRAWDRWRQLEVDTGLRLLVETGNLTIGPADGPAVSGFLTSARAASIPHECLGAAEVRRRWPMLTVPDDLVGGLEIAAGIVFPERCIGALLRLADRAGARLQFNTPVTRWSVSGDTITVDTPDGHLTAGRLLIAAGARCGSLLGECAGLVTPSKVPVHWIRPPDTDGFRLGRLPVNFWQVPNDADDSGSPAYREFYTLPAIHPDGMVKAAFHNGLEKCDPYGRSCTVRGAETAALQTMLGRMIPSLSERPVSTDTCFYTSTPDDHFLMGPLPGNENVFAVALAGHGFKFAPVLGEILADLLQGDTPDFDIDGFSFERFASLTDES
jgi:sarcosine oxidase